MLDLRWVFEYDDRPQQPILYSGILYHLAFIAMYGSSESHLLWVNTCNVGTQRGGSVVLFEKNQG